MGYKIKFYYPNGDTEVDDEVYDTKSEARDAAEDAVLGFSTGADILDDMGEESMSGELEYSIIKD